MIQRRRVGATSTKGETMNMMYKSLQQPAIEHLQGSTTFAARFALGQGLDSETVAQCLEDLANGIRNPTDVAEDMSPITLDDI
jgi:hypothetical protein